MKSDSEKIEDIKEKVKAGFYKSDEVIEEISLDVTDALFQDIKESP